MYVINISHIKLACCVINVFVEVGNSVSLCITKIDNKVKDILIDSRYIPNASLQKHILIYINVDNKVYIFQIRFLFGF